MATYAVSDIHGEYDLFMELLDKICFSDRDTMYILGDILDRGPHPIRTVLKIMEMPNVICLVGNHELMALECLEFLMQEITDDSIGGIDEAIIGNLLTWQRNGSKPTIDEFHALNREMQMEVIEFLREFVIYEEVALNGKNYLLVHSGLGNYRQDKRIEEYSLKELVWDRADYEIQYFPDRYVVTGHTPTQYIKDNPHKGRIFRKNNHIAIDCGAAMPGGRLAAFCLETGEAFYSSDNTKELPEV